jgi:hypothetical protein
MPRFVLAGLLLAACSAVQVSTDYDPETDFSALRSWAWLARRPGGDPRVDNALVNERFRTAVETQMAERGFQKVASGRADFLVAYHTAVQRKIDVDTIYRGYGYGPGAWGWGPTHETVVYEYDQGTLLLDFLDPKERRLLWRGSAKAIVSERSTPEKRTRLVNEAVAKLLARYPPKKK